MKLGLSPVKTTMAVSAAFMVGEEEQSFKVLIDCKVPKDLEDYTEKIKKAGLNYRAIGEANAEIVLGWEDVTDLDGNSVPYTKEALIDAQMKYWGLADAIVQGITLESVKRRDESLKKLESTTRKAKKK